MVLSRTLCTALALAAGAALPAQLDVYWQASRISQELHRINACGEVELRVDLSNNLYPPTATTVPQLRSAHLAPDGKVWVVNFIVAHFTVLDGDGKNLRNIPVASGGRPFSIVFDKAGFAYISMTGTPAVEVYDANAQFVRSYPLTGGNPLGLTIDAFGKVWVAHRIGPPSKITRIDPVTNQTTDFPFPGATSTLGGQIVADYQGLLQKSTLWCIGDSSSELVNFDDAGNWLGTWVIDPNSTTISAMTIDGKRNIWIGNFRDQNIYYFDTTQKKVVTTLSSPPNTLGLAIDSRGRLLATARVSFSGPQPSVVRRFNTTTFAVEHEATVGIGAGSAADSGFHRALVVDPLGDFDKDGVANYDEVIGQSAGIPSAPYDAQSNLDTNLIVSGPNATGSSVEINVRGKSGAAAVVGVALKKAANPICLPGFKGCLLVDPTALTGFSFGGKAPFNVTVPLPNDPKLIGFVVYLQGLYDLGGSLAWSNIDCVNVYK